MLQGAPFVSPPYRKSIGVRMLHFGIKVANLLLL